MHNFAIIGAAGYIAPRHLQAIKDTGNRLIAAADPNDSVGILDRYFPDARFFTEIERFDRFLEKERRRSEESRVHYISICTPNYLHDAHVRLALRLNAHAICEKPLVASPWNLDALKEIEQETGRRVFNVLQLRVLPSLVELRKKLKNEKNRSKVDVCLTYITPRGQWYHSSWKGDVTKSGGIATNIGVHFFDLLSWLFGSVEGYELHLATPEKMSGYIELEWARVRWFLSVDRKDLPQSSIESGKPAFRSLTLDGEELEFSDGFTDLHTRVYENILLGKGYGVDDAKPAIELAYQIRKSEIQAPKAATAHPFLRNHRPVVVNG